MAGVPLVTLARLALSEGQWEEAAHCLEGIHGDNWPWQTGQRLLAEQDLLEGRPAVARDRLAPLRKGVGWEARSGLDSLPVLAWTYLELGDVAEASGMVARAMPHARAEHECLSVVDALPVHAVVAIRQERWEEAARNLEEGLALARSMPYP
jgi:hypothetical protein